MAGLALAICALHTPAGFGAERVLERGLTRVVVRPWESGVAIEHQGLVVSRGSSMVVTKPPWTPHYYLGPAPEAVDGAEEQTIEGGVALTMRHRGEHGAFVGEDVVRVYDDGRVERELDGRFTKDEGEALIQWRIAGLDPVLIIGRPYEAELADGKRTSGVVPVAPTGDDAENTPLAKGFRWIRFDSRIGPVRIECESERPLICYDFRNSRWSNPSRPMFWLGDLGTRFSKDKPIHYRVTFHLPPAPDQSTTRPALRAEARPHAIPEAQSIGLERDPVIIPRPKEARYTDGHLRLPAAALRNLGIAADDEAAAAARAELERFLTEAHSCSSTTAGDSAAAPIRLERASATLPDEGYEVQVGAQAAVIRARDERGFLYGVQTLKSLVVRSPDGGLLIRGAEIRDWPSLAFRGVHLFTGGRGPELHLKLIRDVLAPLKLNHLVLESEYIEWDCCPEIHHPEYGMPKSEVRQILGAARGLGIEVTPLVMSLGHCQWMFQNDQHLDLAEDPEAEWAYCATNPRTYEFIERIYQEAVDLFQPRMFHIGHDEFTDRGRVPYRESSKPYTANELFLMDTKRLHGWLAKRGIRTMMWGDMLLGPGEGPDACHAASVAAANRLRSELPKDIVIADWHYVDVPPERMKSLDVLREAGFQTVASTWDRPGNIVNFAQAAVTKDAKGLLQTTWAGYSLDPQNFAREKQQYAIYVLAAEAAWNADRPIDFQDLLYGEYFLRLMGESRLAPAQRAGWLADLDGVRNERLTAHNARGWFGLGPQHDLSAVPHGTVRLGGVMFRLGDAAPDQPDATVLWSKLSPDPNYPQQVEVRVDNRASQLVFLHVASFARPADALVGHYEVLFEDGTRLPIELRYGRTILACDDLAAAAAAPIVWTGRTPAGARIALRALVWDNPRPDALIRSVVATSDEAAGSLVWLALTGLQAEAAGK